MTPDTFAILGGIIAAIGGLYAAFSATHTPTTPTADVDPVDPEPLLVNTAHPDDGNTWHQPNTARNPYPYRLDVYGPDHDGAARYIVAEHGPEPAPDRSWITTEHIGTTRRHDTAET